MHWLDQKLEALHGLSSSHRRDFLDGVRLFAGEVAAHGGVTACFVSYDGLLIETAGRAADFEALSAMAQVWMMAGKEAAVTLSLGRVRQMVIVGLEHKLALFVIGQLAVGILSPSAVNLARTLSH